jgi:hypothetical protein
MSATLHSTWNARRILAGTHTSDYAMNAYNRSIAQPDHLATFSAEADRGPGRNYPGFLVVLAFAALGLLSAPVLAATAPSLGSTSTYGVVSSTFTNANTAPQTIINGNVCYTTGPTTPPLTINGTAGACPAAAGGDQLSALAILNGQACTPLPVGVPLDAIAIGGNPPGTFSPGCYFRAGALDITASTTVTLNGAGVYIFKSTGGALTTGADSRVNLTGGACASDVFWAPVGATTLGANSGPSLATPTFQGNILDAAGITIGHFANLTGRALAFGGTVTTDAVTISVPACASFVAGRCSCLAFSLPRWVLLPFASWHRRARRFRSGPANELCQLPDIPSTVHRAYSAP